MVKRATKKVYHRIPLAVSLVLRYLHQKQGESLAGLMEIYPQYSKTTLFRHMKLPMASTEQECQRHNKGGRPRTLTDRDKRKIVNALLKLRETEGNFNSTDIRREAGIPEDYVSDRTIRRHLNNMGYHFTQCRRKGQLLKEDLVKRLKFAKRCKRLPEGFWREGVAFYLDGTGWVHKTNPVQHARTARTRTWKKKGESLSQFCTSKGRKEGVGGKMARFMVAIAYGRGVTKCHQYIGNINAETCATFIREHFPCMFEQSHNPIGKLFLQDGDPSQNSAMAREAMDSVGCRVFKIPARSPDLNPIENIFHLIGKQLKKDALEKKLNRETYSQFCTRVRRTVKNFSSEIIDHTIDSMPRRIDMVIKNKGQRTKY